MDLSIQAFKMTLVMLLEMNNSAMTFLSGHALKWGHKLDLHQRLVVPR